MPFATTKVYLLPIGLMTGEVIFSVFETKSWFSETTRVSHTNLKFTEVAYSFPILKTTWKFMEVRGVRKEGFSLLLKLYLGFLKLRGKEEKVAPPIIKTISRFPETTWEGGEGCSTYY